MKKRAGANPIKTLFTSDPHGTILGWKKGHNVTVVPSGQIDRMHTGSIDAENSPARSSQDRAILGLRQCREECEPSASVSSMRYLL
jgi:hypothetical protein